MKIKELIEKLSQFDPEQDILFSDSMRSCAISVDAELVKGYSVGYSKKEDPIGTRAPFFVEHERAHMTCEDGKTFLDFRSSRIKPAIYLRSKEPDFRAAYNKWAAKETSQSKLFTA